MQKLLKTWAIAVLDVVLLYMPFTDVIDNAGKIISALCGIVLTFFTVRKLRMDYKNRSEDNLNKQIERETLQVKLEQEHIKLAMLMEKNKAKAIMEVTEGSSNDTAASNQ